MCYSGADSAPLLERYLNDPWLSKQLCVETIDLKACGGIIIEFCRGRGRHRLRHVHVNSADINYRIPDQLHISDANPDFRIVNGGLHKGNHIYRKSEKYPVGAVPATVIYSLSLLRLFNGVVYSKTTESGPFVNGSVSVVS